MLEFLIGVIISPWMLVSILIASTFFEANHRSGMVSFLLIGALAISYFLFSPAPVQVAYVVLGWVPVGLIWSLFRWKRYVSGVVERAKKDNTPSSDIYLQSDLSLKENLYKIVYWISAWPISFVESIIGDFLRMIQVLVLKIAKGTFARISERALKDLEAHNNVKK